MITQLGLIRSVGGQLTGDNIVGKTKFQDLKRFVGP
jgi:hypothetical protein